MLKRVALAVAVVLFGHAAVSNAAPQKLTVAAGEFDRSNTVVPVTVPESLDPGLYVLRPDAGQGTPLQVGPGGRGAFILGDLKKGQTRAYRIERVVSDSADYPDGVQVIRQGDRLKVVGGGSEILQYQGEKTPLPQGYEPQYQRGGYIHPVYTPSGKLVTDDYPPKHKHHHGIWSPWTMTSFEGRAPDFWNMGKKTGTVEFVGINATWSGPVAGGFSTNHRMVDLSAKPQPKPAIDETWNVIVCRPVKAGRPMYVFDLTTNHRCASDSPLVLPKYHYGGLGYRGHRDWEDKRNCFFLTSEGKDRSNGNETTGKWCHVGGKVDGEMTGVAVLCHPDNFRFPQPMRLNPDEPFFCYAPSQGGDWAIEPGKPYVARYRFVVADGGPDKKEIERLWNDYAKPPTVTVE
jgi:methane monooxygenase PmoA-like